MAFWWGRFKRMAELERKLEEAEKQTQIARNMLDAVNNSTHLGIWTAYFDGRGELQSVVYSDEFRRMLGYTRSELPDDLQILGTLIHPDETQRVFAAFGSATADRSNHTKYDINYRLLTKSGNYRWFHAAGQCLRDPDGLPSVFIGTFTDIDESLRLSEEMAVSRRRQDAVDRMMLEGTWSMDLTRHAIDDVNSPMIFSGQFKKILGYKDSRDFPDIMKSWITKIHPDDVGAASAAMGKQLSDPTGKTVFDMEYRMLHKDGNYRWVRASSTVVWSRDKKTPLMAAGTILDITKQKTQQLDFQNEMAPKIQALRDGIANMAATTRAAAEQMRDVDARQAEMAEAAQKIGQSVEASMKTVSSVKYIADQTRLLSVNAYIEAARAGDVGKSFSVVASEVQSLANSTKEITDNIATILTEMNTSVREVLEKIERISGDVASENQEMADIDRMIAELSVFASEIGDLVSTLFKS